MIKRPHFIVFACSALLTTMVMGTTVSAQALPDHLAKMDKDGDGKLSPEEWVRDKPSLFKRIDTNGDKALSKDEIEKFYVAIAPADDPKTIKRIADMAAADANADGKVTLEELTAYNLAGFKKRDKNADGFITAADL